jgi:hypothetical protein
MPAWGQRKLTDREPMSANPTETAPAALDRSSTPSWLIFGYPLLWNVDVGFAPEAVIRPLGNGCSRTAPRPPLSRPCFRRM